MLRKCVIIATIPAAIAVGLLYRPASMKAQDLVITTRGLDELGVKLESPYGRRSLQHVLLTNAGRHYILACDLMFEVTTRDGKVLSAEKVVYDPDPLMEKDFSKRKALLMKEPGIAPGTRWLIGVGDAVGLEGVKETVPPFDEQSIVQELFQDKDNYKQLSVTLTGVIIETGEAFGPKAQTFRKHVYEKLLKEYGNEK